MPKKIRKGVKLKKETPELKRLKTRIRNLKLKLSESLPKTELDAIRRNLEAKIGGLEAKLAQSVPKVDAEILAAKVKELESRLGVSILKEEAEAQLKDCLLYTSDAADE